MAQALRDWLVGFSYGERVIEVIVDTSEVLLLLLLAYLVDFITKQVILRLFGQFARRTETAWDDLLIERGVFHKVAHLAPALVVWKLAPVVFTNEALIGLARTGSEVYLLLMGLLAINSLLNGINYIYQMYPVSRRIPIKGYLQVVMLLLSIAAAIILISILLNKQPWVLLSGLGALTAVLLLIFKDTILGLVAGIQLVANDMVRPGDWIEMPKYDADGDVMEITLNTVKVRNWDKTITTIPTYSLISDSFKNWRGMSESGGRRIKRSVYIDVRSIKFCSPEMIQRFSKIERIKAYIKHKQEELARYNQEHHIDESVLVNGRRMTNIGTFRAYVTQYLLHHPKIHKDMTFLIRHLQPTERGLPLEIYVFSNDQVWANYEGLQADIFDHIFAALPEFELRPYQNPTGNDIESGLQKLSSTLQSSNPEATRS